LGWGVNVLKSMLTPSQDFEYIGVRYLTHLGLMTPPLDRILKIWERVKLLRQGPVTARVALSVIGLLGSAERQVPSGRLNFRALQVCLRAQFRMGVHSLDFLVSFHNDPSVLQALDWWSLPENVFKGQSLGPFLQHRTLFTDASMTHWGAHSDAFQVSGAWSNQEKLLSINQLEMKAVTLALQHSSWHDQRILVASDNTTVVAYLNNQGGTRSMMMLDLTWELFEVALSRRLLLRARHIPGRLNRLADLLSRSGQVVNTEWTLSPAIAKTLWSVWGRPSIDLMATHLNTQLPTFVSPFPHDLAFAVDAMSLSWDRMEAYIFPPWAMILDVLNKLLLHVDCVMTLIVPRWPNRSWFPLLLSCLCEAPLRLPLRDDLLSQPLSGRLHGSLASLGLHACRVSSSLRSQEDFLNRCLRDWPLGINEIPHSGFTTPDGSFTLFGVTNEVPIPSLPLFQ
jgi:hypothetical protein